MKLVLNSKSDNFYNHISSLFEHCKSFYINVAFINYSGVQLLLDSLKRCEKKNIKGYILTSTYLNFTEAKAIRKLQEFKNIELKIYTSNKRGFHSKAYIFEFEEEYKTIIGSSNITASAFKSNIEWNLEVSSKDDDFTKEIKEEFFSLFKESLEINERFLKEYENFKTLQKHKEFIYNKTITPNPMQDLASKNLKDLRDNAENKALIISATGSGKTYLSAFDVKAYNPKKILFVVHRENILLSAKKSFEKLIPHKSCGIYSGNKKDLSCEYLFATIQSISKNYKEFKKDEFDYIIIDEAHHASANSYEKILEYFSPKFLLGLTATPNRRDEKNIYEIFDDNIALDIRLQDALELELITPFHYFGINDISVDYEGIDLKDISKLASLLSIHKRVNFILDKLQFYSFDGSKRKALGFCVDVNHARYMSEEFSKKGIHSTYLSSKDSIEKREKIIKDLECDENPLEVIFSVDIFNEGIDIPSINTALFLRPTNSPIVFTQQLGRGLRKHKNKEFLTVLDFIGNHQKAYLIASALKGERVIDKESIAMALHTNFAMFSDSFVSFDEVTKNTILAQLEKTNFSTFSFLKEEFLELKSSLGYTPNILDFFSLDITNKALNYISESKSFYEFTNRVFKIKDENEEFLKAIRFIESLLPLKRVEEFIILKELINRSSLDINTCEKLLKKYKQKVYKTTISHSFRFLNQEFFDVLQINRWQKLVELKENKLYKSKVFEEILKTSKYKKLINQSLEFGILLYEKEFQRQDYGLPFLKLYSKYNMKDIALVCNLDKIHSSFRGSGQLKFENDYFLFINLDKENAPKSKRYKNSFYSNKLFTWQSKPNATFEKGDGYNIINHKSLNKKIHIFVRKYIKVDNKTQNFIYLGLADVKSYEKEKPIHFTFELKKSLSKELFDEFTIKV